MSNTPGLFLSQERGVLRALNIEAKIFLTSFAPSSFISSIPVFYQIILVETQSENVFFFKLNG